MANTVRASVAELARVVDVDVLRYVCSVVTENTNRTLQDIPFASPYCNNPEGEGLTVVPEVGSQAILLHPGDDGEPVLIGFIMTPGADLYRGNRPVAKPGDIRASTRDGNFMILHRGGVVQIGAGPAAQRMYIPTGRLIRDICQAYHLETFGGSLVWEVEDQDLQAPGCLFTLKAYENADDKEHSVTLRIGKAFAAADARKGMSYDVPSGVGLTADIGYLELEVNKQQTARRFLLRVDRGGNEFLDSSGGYNRRYKGNALLRVEGAGSQTFLGGLAMGVGTDAPAVVAGNLEEVVLKDINRVAGGTATDRCLRRVIDSPAIQLGSPSASEPAVLGLQLATWLATHTHLPSGMLNPLHLAQLQLLLSKTVRLV